MESIRRARLLFANNYSWCFMSGIVVTWAHVLLKPDHVDDFIALTASPLSDAIVWSGLQQLVPNLPLAWGEEAADPGVRLAGPFGGWFPIPHAFACGTLMGSAQRENGMALQSRVPSYPPVAVNQLTITLMDSQTRMPNTKQTM
jgi:hypothetical protein